MSRRPRRLLFAALAVVLAASAASAADLPLERIRLPAGFRIELFASGLPGARSLALGANGTVFVGTRSQGTVYALRDEDGDGRAERTFTIARGLDQPNGVAFRDGALYVAEVSRLIRFDGIEDRLASPPLPAVVLSGLPTDRAHGWKFIAFGPDGWLYVPVGAPCNICEPKDDRHAVILRVRPDGSGLQVFARGVRNTVGFDWSPDQGELWFTDNGRDWLGDDAPPDELNRAPVADLHFGYPYLHGSSIRDPDFGDGRDLSPYTRPERELGAHVAALGMRFYDASGFPPDYRGQIFIAEHGSWNRSSPVGYRVSLVRIRDGRAVSYEPFAEGWLQGRTAWGRPVDVQPTADGSLLVSDDLAGAVYRIAYAGAP